MRWETDPNFTSRQFDLNHWLPALQTEHMHSVPLRCLWLTDNTVCALLSWETDVCVDHVYQCWFYCWVLNHIVSRMELPFTCMSVVINVIILLWFSASFLSTLLFKRFKQFYFQFVLPASWMYGWMELVRVRMRWALLHFIPLFIIVLHCRLIFMHSLFSFGFQLLWETFECRSHDFVI